MDLGALLRLARVSNLPTVWSNVLAASVLAGGLEPRTLACVLAAMSALYMGGMLLNDAFDREIDTRERPERPLPSGAVAPSTAWMIGGGLLAAGAATLAAFGVQSAAASVALAGAIVLYDAWHKGNPLSPLIMGTCRALVYIGTAATVGLALSPVVLVAALALLLYIVGLTEAAKRGAGRVGLLIAGVSLLDAAIAASAGSAITAAICVLFFCLTLALQRVVPGT